MLCGFCTGDEDERNDAAMKEIVQQLLCVAENLVLTSESINTSIGI